MFRRRNAIAASIEANRRVLPSNLAGHGCGEPLGSGETTVVADAVGDGVSDEDNVGLGPSGVEPAPGRLWGRPAGDQGEERPDQKHPAAGGAFDAHRNSPSSPAHGS